MLYGIMILIAQAGDQVAEKVADKAPEQPFGGILSTPILPIAAVFALFYFLVLLPNQRKEKKQRESLLANLKKNDEVVTAAGIIGVVSHIKEGADEVTLKIDDNARIRVLKSTIIKIVPRESDA